MPIRIPGCRRNWKPKVTSLPHHAVWSDASRLGERTGSLYLTGSRARGQAKSTLSGHNHRAVFGTSAPERSLHQRDDWCSARVTDGDPIQHYPVCFARGDETGLNDR